SGFLDKKWKVEFVNGVKINYLYLPYDNSFSSIKRIYIFILFLWHSLIKLIKTDGDLVLATSTPLTIGIPAIIKKLAHKTPYVFEVRDVWPEAVIAIGAIRNFLVKKCLFWLEEVIYRRSVAIVPLSSDMQESIITRFPQFEAKTRIVIENISEVTRFQSDSKDSIWEQVLGTMPRFSVLYAGTFGKVNGVHKIVELAEKTYRLDDKIIYVLVGAGSEKESVISLAEEKNVLGRNVFILDPVSKGELPLWYNSASMG